MFHFSLGKNGDDIAQILKDDGISTQDITMVQGEIVNFINNFKQSQAAGAEEIAMFFIGGLYFQSWLSVVTRFSGSVMTAVATFAPTVLTGGFRSWLFFLFVMTYLLFGYDYFIS